MQGYFGQNILFYLKIQFGQNILFPFLPTINPLPWVLIITINIKHFVVHSCIQSTMKIKVCFALISYMFL